MISFFPHKKKKKKAEACEKQKRAAPTKQNMKAYRPYKMRISEVFWLIPLAMVIGFGSVIGFFAGEEIRHSKFQSEYFTEMASKITFKKEAGAAPDFYVPETGPYNQRLGYSYLPFFIKVLQAEGYDVTHQMRTSDEYKKLIHEGIYPIYRPKATAGLLIKSRDKKKLYRAQFPSRVFPNFDSIPPLLIDTLLFIENRELLLHGEPTRNPVIEWDRFAYAALGQALKYFVPSVNLGGGSTLATQIEKFRFSPDGQTGSPIEKLRQIISGSLRVYIDGPNTRDACHKIILDYLNNTPLSARSGFGEVNSLGDGLWVWFGRGLNEVKLGLKLPEENSFSLRRKATIYREVLGLILAQRRPTYYLHHHRAELEDLINRMLTTLQNEKVISFALFEAVRATKLRFLPKSPPCPHKDFLDHKASSAMRRHLLSMLGLHDLYELDRLDLVATSTLDAKAQGKVSAFLKKMSQPDFLKSIGLYGKYLLSSDNDPSVIHWSVLLYEKTPHGNILRVQTDNIDGPLDMNEGVKLDLGSTAKLRTLVTYLEIMGELYRRYAGLSVQDLRALTKEAPDVLTSWTTVWLADNPKATLEEMLQASMARRYSANPYETFFTGGGEHHFVNFSKESNGRRMALTEAFRSSVNLVFIRLMRDIVNYTIAQGPQTKKELLSNPANPARVKYLERYADKEGTVFLKRFMRLYDGLSFDEILEKVTARTRKSLHARTILFRAIRSKAKFQAYATYMKEVAKKELEKEKLKELFEKYPPDRYALVDQGYITGINPLEVWLVNYKLAHPKASNKKALRRSHIARLESYAWLLHAGKKGAQDSRIRILLEQDAFVRIRRRWARLGYPFERLVPSLATAIGTSADRPAALVELVGILLNDGVRRPMRRVEGLHFAKGTPYETIIKPSERGSERVLDPAVARVVRAAMKDVAEKGTARRLRGAYVDVLGQSLAVGAKTGTGDHRYEEYGAHHRLLSSRVVNRTGTITFFLGNRFFGAVTAHVAGEKAAKYKFTSALSAQMLKSLAPALQPLITPGGPLVPVIIEGTAPREKSKENLSVKS